MEPTSFYETDGAPDRFRATEWTRGPWSLEHQHGGPPAALLARAVETARSDAAFAVVRFTVEFLRPVPIGPMRVEVEPLKGGRTVERYAARLLSGDTLLLTATALCISERNVALDVAPLNSPPPSSPETVETYAFPFFSHPRGYQIAVDLRYVRGAWGEPDVTCWLRQRCPLLPDEEPTPLQRTLVAADAGHGIAIPLDPAGHTFVNADLSVHLARPLRGEWVGMESHSVAQPTGIGLCHTRLWDAAGPVGRALQSLVVVQR